MPSGINFVETPRLSALSSLRETLSELGALPRSAAQPVAPPRNDARNWLRSALRTFESLERICCTAILCCGRVGRALAASCGPGKEDRCR